MTSFDELRLETSRLVLRPPRADDLDAWAEMMLDEPSARFIGGTMPRAVCWRQLMTMIGAWHAQGFAMFSVIEKESGRWIGRVGPWQPEGWPGTEIGWAIVRDGAVDVTVKLTQEEREMAHLLPYVRIASHVGRYGWITANVTDEESLESALEWLRESYWLKCPAELKAAVEGED